MSDRDVELESRWRAAPPPWFVPEFRRIEQAVRFDSLHHALLISGGHGLGKRWLAAAVAGYLLCRQPDQDGACGHCEGCSTAQAGAHGDYRWVAIEPEKRAISVEQIRGAIEFVHQSAAYGGRKILVIEQAHTMSQGAANSLLKTLEEPAGRTTIMVVTERPWQLPATVRSRCQWLKLDRPSPKIALDWLQSVVGDRVQAEQGLALAEGRPISALAVLSGGADEVVALENVVGGLLRGEIPWTRVASELAGLDPVSWLGALQRAIEREVRQQSERSVEQQRALLHLHRIVALALERVHRGSNPAKDILAAQVCQCVELSRMPEAGVLRELQRLESALGSG
jgi:DNA polymerase-3 subunit delta'